MPFPFDEYPWAKFEDLNIAYMIHRLGLIISEANAKLEELDAWKTATEQDLESWKNSTMDLIAEWEREFMADVHQWEHDTEQDLAQWKIDTIAALDTWKATFITEYNALRVEVEHIRDMANDAAQEATQAAEEATEAAASASADAASISASAAQIQTNADDIADLKSASSAPAFSWILGRYISGTGSVGKDSNFAISTKIPVNTGDAIKSEISGSGTPTLWLVFYNEDTFISRIAADLTAGNIVPAGANILRFSISKGSPMTAEIASEFHFTFYCKPMSYQESVAAKENLDRYNCTDILEGKLNVINDFINSSFSITANGDNGFTFYGTANAGANFNLFTSLNSLPSWIEAGKTYYFSNSSENIFFEVYPMNGSNIIPGTSISVKNGKKPITIPGNCDGIIIRLRIVQGTYSYETAYVHGFDTLTNKELTEQGLLLPTGDTTDRTAAIVTMLTNNGICRLGAGNYYVKNIDMPDNSMIIGCGKATKLIMSGADAGYGVKLGSGCTLKNFWIMGANEITPTESIGNRHGVLWEGNYAASQTAPARSMVDGVYITSFTGGGITLRDTGYSVRSCVEISNSYIFNCGAGINVEYWSEYNKFTAVHCTSNYYGCINNGGNNIFVGCDFSGNKVGMLMDNSQSQSPNNSHGSCSACTFNHSDSDNGFGIKILNCDNGFVFNGCQIFYSQILINNSEGVVICSSNIGSANCNITINGGGAILFAGNMFSDTPTKTITGNNKVHFANCYVKSTGTLVS